MDSHDSSFTVHRQSVISAVMLQISHAIDVLLAAAITGLRDIILRNTNITYLPRDIWVATGAGRGTCDAGAALAAAGSSGQQQQQISMLQGQAQMQISAGSGDGWVKITVTSAGQGWLGFGVAKPGRVGLGSLDVLLPISRYLCPDCVLQFSGAIPCPLFAALKDVSCSSSISPSPGGLLETVVT